jgi:hypothetical protein
MSCEPVDLEFKGITTKEDSLNLLNKYWYYQNSYKNNEYADTIIIDDSSFYYEYHSIDEYLVDDYGYYNFDFADNQRKNKRNNQYKYADSINIINNNNIIWMSEEGEQIYNIIELNDSILSISYTSFKGNFIIINLKSK